MKREGDSTYKIRENVEKAINHFKDSFCVAGRKTQNEKTLPATPSSIEWPKLQSVLLSISLLQPLTSNPRPKPYHIFHHFNSDLVQKI